MFRRFLLMLLLMAALGVSSAFLLRELFVRDFGRLNEAVQEDRASWIVSDLESAFGKRQSWDREMAIEDAVWALNLGMETKVRDHDGKIVMETQEALSLLSPGDRGRLIAGSGYGRHPAIGQFYVYPLFLHGEEIGQVEVRFLPDERSDFFISRTNRHLLISALILGVIAVALSFVLARRLSRPIIRLSRAAQSISQGNLNEQVKVAGRDELASLSRSFNQMAHKLQLQNKLRKEICANLAHELRTPLTIMRGQLEGILDGVIINDEARIGLLLEENQRLTNVVASMEEFFQAQASALTLSPFEVPVRQLLENLAKNFEIAARENGVKLTIEADSGATVYADPERLAQILINLISNALKATALGGHIFLSGKRSSTGCTITVADTGRGIAEEELSLVFERFYRGKEGGLGLGLAIVRELVDAHSGSIDVSSTLGKGTAFALQFPDAPTSS
ncbi:MAG: HAMP domain-containing histidine kinase [Geobacter sp.]|nr:MAG: HAMP domain-containing histidine kinase [Geobacter sp.]